MRTVAAETERRLEREIHQAHAAWLTSDLSAQLAAPAFVSVRRNQDGTLSPCDPNDPGRVGTVGPLVDGRTLPLTPAAPNTITLSRETQDAILSFDAEDDT